MLFPWGRTLRIFIYGGMRDRSMRSGTKLAREIQLTDWSTAGNLSNRSSGVQIPRDICTRFGRYLYSTKCSWIINSVIPEYPKRTETGHCMICLSNQNRGKDGWPRLVNIANFSANLPHKSPATICHVTAGRHWWTSLQVSLDPVNAIFAQETTVSERTWSKAYECDVWRAGNEESKVVVQGFTAIGAAYHKLVPKVPACMFHSPLTSTLWCTSLSFAHCENLSPRTWNLKLHQVFVVKAFGNFPWYFQLPSLVLARSLMVQISALRE